MGVPLHNSFEELSEADRLEEECMLRTPGHCTTESQLDTHVEEELLGAQGTALKEEHHECCGCCDALSEEEFNWQEVSAAMRQKVKGRREWSKLMVLPYTSGREEARAASSQAVSASGPSGEQVGIIREITVSSARTVD